MDDAPHVITLELRLDGDAPIGRASTPGERQHEFAGWLRLIAAIEALATGDRQTAARPGPPPASGPDDMHDDTAGSWP